MINIVPLITANDAVIVHSNTYGSGVMLYDFELWKYADKPAGGGRARWYIPTNKEQDELCRRFGSTINIHHVFYVKLIDSYGCIEREFFIEKLSGKYDEEILEINNHFVYSFRFTFDELISV